MEGLTLDCSDSRELPFEGPLDALDELERGQEDVGPLGYCESANLEFSDIRYRVPSHRGGKVEVLKGISGTCRSGRVLALMGASGAGKTSLIDILAGHVRAGVSGKLTINGTRFKAAEFRKRSCYVLQRDVVLATATVLPSLSALLAMQIFIARVGSALGKRAKQSDRANEDATSFVLADLNLVKEAITTSALLRLPQTMSRQEKKQRVLDVIQQLELEDCADTLAGDDAQGIKGISGGERRRLSVAMGLVTDPQIILLDEPTSGLDSETATQLVTCLARLARANRTVVASIHQPNSHITDCFDDLLLLAGGRCIFSGPWQASVGYFASLGYVCPLYTNPADFYLTAAKDAAAFLAAQWNAGGPAWLAKHDEGDEKFWDSRGSFMPPKPHNASCDSVDWDSTPMAKSASSRGLLPQPSSEGYIKAAIPADADVSTSYATPRSRVSSAGRPPLSPKSPFGGSMCSVAESCRDAPGEPQPAVSWLFAMRVLVVRFVRTWVRTPHLLYSYLAQYIFAGIFMGLMYVQLGTSRASSIFDRQASLFLVLVLLAFTPSNTACTVWESERLLLRREANSGAYKLSTFFAAKTLVTFPMQAFVTLLYCILMYFITGYQYEASKFFIFVATCICYQLTSETLGTICAIVTKTATMGILLSSTLLMVLVAFSGFLINHTPVFFRWISKISFVTFAYSAIYQNELDGLHMTYTRADGSALPDAGLSISLATSEYKCLPTGATSAARGPGGNNFTVGQNIGILVAILFGLRTIAFALLQAAYKLKKL